MCCNAHNAHFESIFRNYFYSTNVWCHEITKIAYIHVKLSDNQTIRYILLVNKNDNVNNECMQCATDINILKCTPVLIGRFAKSFQTNEIFPNKNHRCLIWYLRIESIDTMNYWACANHSSTLNDSNELAWFTANRCNMWRTIYYFQIAQMFND